MAKGGNNRRGGGRGDVWSDEEDEMLLGAIGKRMTFTEISDFVLTGRSPEGLRKRWQNLCELQPERTAPLVPIVVARKVMSPKSPVIANNDAAFLDAIGRAVDRMAQTMGVPFAAALLVANHGAEEGLRIARARNLVGEAA